MADDVQTLAANVHSDEITTSNGSATIADVQGRLPQAQINKPAFGPDGTTITVDNLDGKRFPVSDPKAAQDTTLAAVLAKLADPATQTTLAAILTRLSSDPSTATNQASQSTKLDTVHSDLAAVLGKITADPSTGTLQGAGNTSLTSILAKLSADPATQTTLAAMLAKITSDPSTGTAQATQATKLDTLHTDLGAMQTALGPLATQTTVAAVLAKLTVDPSTGAKQDTQHTDLQALLTKLNGTVITAPNSAGDVAAALNDGRATVTTPGTAVPIAGSPTACKWVTVTALTSNTDQVNVGGAGALATLGASTGRALGPGDWHTFPVTDVTKVYADARVAGEGVSWTAGS